MQMQTKESYLSVMQKRKEQRRQLELRRLQRRLSPIPPPILPVPGVCFCHDCDASTNRALVVSGVKYPICRLHKRQAFVVGSIITFKNLDRIEYSPRCTVLYCKNKAVVDHGVFIGYRRKLAAFACKEHDELIQAGEEVRFDNGLVVNGKLPDVIAS